MDLDDIPVPRDSVHYRVLQLWRSLVLEGTVPSRQSFDPVALRGDLRHVFFVGVEDGADDLRFLMKVHGSEVNAILGVDATGKYLDELLAESRWRKIVKGFKTCLSQRRPVLEEFSSVFPGREHIQVTRLVLPMSDETGRARFILGSLARKAG